MQEVSNSKGGMTMVERWLVALRCGNTMVVRWLKMKDGCTKVEDEGRWWAAAAAAMVVVLVVVVSLYTSLLHYAKHHTNIIGCREVARGCCLILELSRKISRQRRGAQCCVAAARCPPLVDVWPWGNAVGDIMGTSVVDVGRGVVGKGLPGR